MSVLLYISLFSILLPFFSSGEYIVMQRWNGSASHCHIIESVGISMIVQPSVDMSAPTPHSHHGTASRAMNIGVPPPINHSPAMFTTVIGAVMVRNPNYTHVLDRYSRWMFTIC